MRDSGEGQRLEFKMTYPENGRELAKDIAAFASAGGGTILIGVDDSGDLVGLSAAETVEGRDALMKRIAGVCLNTVKPAIMPLVDWAVEDDKVVMVVTVPKGTEPIYYAANVPYIRHLSTCRPAEPHEVVRSILSHFQVGQSEFEAIPDGMIKLMSALLPVFMFGEEADRRMINPWFNNQRAQLKQAAMLLRDIVAAEQLSAHGKSLKELASLLEEVAQFRMTLGSGGEYLKLVADAVSRSQRIWESVIKPVQSKFGGIDKAKPVVVKAINQLSDLTERGHDMLFGGDSGDFLRSVSAVGAELLSAAIAYLRNTVPTLAGELSEIGHELHLIETTTLYLDGGQSQERVLSEVVDLKERLQSLSVTAFAG